MILRLKAIWNLQARVKSLEDEMKSFRLDWDEMYERYRKMAARVGRDRAKLEAAESQTSANGETQETASGSPFTSTTYSARQKEVQQAILKRRGGIQ